MKTWILKRERSEEEKLRRHLHGDKGAKFSKAKVPCIDRGGVIGALTTMMTKDILLIELYDERDIRTVEEQGCERKCGEAESQ